MTTEIEILKFCGKCSQYKNCGYIQRGMVSRCERVEAFQEGFEAGEKHVLDAIERVFKENTNPISPDSHVLFCIKNTIKQLKK